MYFPRHWKRATVSGPNSEGKNFEVMAWGWSDVSDAEALQKAEARARAALAQLPARGKARAAYYDGRPFREPVLEDVSRGGSKAVITRNSLGCEVLNTDSVGFADLDYEPLRVSFFSSLFGSGKKKQTEHRQAWEAKALDRLHDWQRTRPGWGLRVYRTAGGFRALVTSQLLQAESAEARQWLQTVGSDPLYQRLCADQHSFRARLTPKPWRCNVRKPSVCFPYGTPKDEQRMADWLATYREKSQGFAICQHIGTIGADAVHPDVRPVLDLHDARTLVGSSLPLA
jgi:hypothetical protein